MYKVTRLIHLTPDAEPDQLLGALRASATASGAVRALVEPTLPGVRNGGDLLAHLQFQTSDHWSAARDGIDKVLASPAIRHVDGAEYRTTGRGADEPSATGSVYRTLLLRVAPGTAPETVARFESELLMMTDFIPAMRAWQLSRVAVATGASAWTHVWEQEFSDLDGLTGPYLMHPIHWAYVDRWFDPECPEFIVRDRVCHSYCRCAAPVLAAGGQNGSG